MNRIARCDWLPKQLARSGYGLCLQGKFTMFWCFIPYNKSFIDQACSVKMTAWVCSSFFFCVFMDLDFVSGHKHAKKNIQPSRPHIWPITRIYLPLTDLVWGLYIMGYWPSMAGQRSYFACFCVNSKIEQGAKEDPYSSASTEQAWSVKDLLYNFWENFSYGTQPWVSEWTWFEGCPILLSRFHRKKGSYESFDLLNG